MSAVQLRLDCRNRCGQMAHMIQVDVQVQAGRFAVGGSPALPHAHMCSLRVFGCEYVTAEYVTAEQIMVRCCAVMCRSVTVGEPR
jgi:hypothetical protein